jgi:hypothetical protein
MVTAVPVGMAVTELPETVPAVAETVPPVAVKFTEYVNKSGSQATVPILRVGCASTVTVIVAVVAHCPGVGCEGISGCSCELFTAGAQVPAMPLLRSCWQRKTASRTDRSDLSKTRRNRFGLTTTVMVVLVAHCPGAGCKSVSGCLRIIYRRRPAPRDAIVRSCWAAKNCLPNRSERSCAKCRRQVWIDCERSSWRWWRTAPSVGVKV